MKFDEKYPKARTKDEINWFIRHNIDQDCSICGEPTRWLSLAISGKNICSTECSAAMWLEYRNLKRLKK